MALHAYRLFHGGAGAAALGAGHVRCTEGGSCDDRVMYLKDVLPQRAFHAKAYRPRGHNHSGHGAKRSSSHSEPLIAVPTSLGGTITVDTELKGLPPTVSRSYQCRLGGTITVEKGLTGLSLGVSAPTKKAHACTPLSIMILSLISPT